MNKIFVPIAIAAASVAAPYAFAGPDARSPDADRAAANESQPVKDAYLKGRIISAYAFNKNVSAFDIDVRVDNGVAFLSGAVDSSMERDLAVEIARGIEDVRDVKSDIALKPGARATAEEKRAQHRSLGRTIDDASLTAQIKTKLLANKNVSGTSINVTTKNGVVTLAGTVKSEAEKDLAVHIARNVAGKADVRDQLLVAGHS